MAKSAFDGSLMSPPVEDLLDKVDSKFSLVTLAARRARQINAYHAHLGGNMGAIVPPQFDDVTRKPLSASFDEIASGFVVPIREAIAAVVIPESEEAEEFDAMDLGDEIFIASEIDGNGELD